MVTRQFAVLGLGRFGLSVARTLAKLGGEVLAVDIDEDRVKEIAPYVTQALQADATDEAVLREIGIRNFDAVVVAMSDFEASLLVTSCAKELGARKVLVKAGSDIHGKILQRIGADVVVFPEKDMGSRVAFSLMSGSVIDYIELSADYSVVEVRVTGAMAGKTLRNLDLRRKTGLNVVAIKRATEVEVSVSPDEPLREGDILIAIGTNEGVQKLNGLVERS